MNELSVDLQCIAMCMARVGWLVGWLVNFCFSVLLILVFTHCSTQEIVLGKALAATELASVVLFLLPPTALCRLTD